MPGKTGLDVPGAVQRIIAMGIGGVEYFGMIEGGDVSSHGLAIELRNTDLMLCSGIDSLF